MLEISATPFIFTFKLWDWGRRGLDGLPCPINLQRGRESLEAKRDTDWVKDNLINQVTLLAQGEGGREERTGGTAGARPGERFVMLPFFVSSE